MLRLLSPPNSSGCDSSASERLLCCSERAALGILSFPRLRRREFREPPVFESFESGQESVLERDALLDLHAGTRGAGQKVMFGLYEATYNEGNVGGPEYVFASKGYTISAGEYCDVGEALDKELGQE